MQLPKLFGCHPGGVLCVAALLCAPAWGVGSPQPGAVNYVEGQVSIGGQSLSHSSVGSAVLEQGQTLTTGNGKAEILLTPGVFFRIDDQSAATMVSPGLANTEVRLLKGRAMIEVDEIHKENNLRVDEGRASTRLLKKGLYDFNADVGSIKVFDGQATLQDDDRQVKVKGGREVRLSDASSLKPRKFDKDSARDTFYNWSKLRSDYLAEANADAARYYYRGGLAWPSAGWYWDPWYSAYTFVPGSGLLYSPFGWTYYSPWWDVEAPYLYRGRIRHRFNPSVRGNTRVLPRGPRITPGSRHLAPQLNSRMGRTAGPGGRGHGR